MDRTDDNGQWTSEDAITWLLVAPSEAFHAQLAADPQPAVQPAAEVVAAQAISDEITVRLDPAGTISEIKAAITDGLAAAIVSLGG